MKFEIDRTVITPEIEFEMIKASTYRSLLELNYSPWFTVGSPFDLPRKSEGVCVSFVEKTGKYIASYSEDISRRYWELLDEPNTSEMKRFCYALVDGHEERKRYRKELKNMFLFEEFDKNDVSLEFK